MIFVIEYLCLDLCVLQLKVSLEEKFSWTEWEIWAEFSTWNDELAYGFLFWGLFLSGFVFWLLAFDWFNVILMVLLKFCEGWSVPTLVSNGNRRALQL